MAIGGHRGPLEPESQCCHIIFRAKTIAAASGEAWETPEHLTFYCPRLVNSRVDFLGTREGWTEKWHPEAVFKQIVNTGILELLEDDTDYSKQ